MKSQSVYHLKKESDKEQHEKSAAGIFIYVGLVLVLSAYKYFGYH